MRLAALKAVCNFLPVPDVTGFEALLEPMVTVVASALTEGDEEKARDSCDLLIELVDNDVKFLRPVQSKIRVPLSAARTLLKRHRSIPDHAIAAVGARKSSLWAMPGGKEPNIRPTRSSQAPRTATPSS